MAAPKTSPRRERSKPDPANLEAITSAGAPRRRVTKAPQEDPVLGVSSHATATASQSAEPAAPATEAKPKRARKPKVAAPADRSTEAEKPEPKKKVGFYQTPADTDRARAAWFHTRSFEMSGSLSDFIANAVVRETKRLEAVYNNGKPWPAVKTGSIPTGRPAD